MKHSMEKMRDEEGREEMGRKKGKKKLRGKGKRMMFGRKG